MLRVFCATWRGFYDTKKAIAKAKKSKWINFSLQVVNWEDVKRNLLLIGKMFARSFFFLFGISFRHSIPSYEARKSYQECVVSTWIDFESVSHRAEHDIIFARRTALLEFYLSAAMKLLPFKSAITQQPNRWAKRIATNEFRFVISALIQFFLALFHLLRCQLDGSDRWLRYASRLWMDQ